MEWETITICEDCWLGDSDMEVCRKSWEDKCDHCGKKIEPREKHHEVTASKEVIMKIPVGGQ